MAEPAPASFWAFLRKNLEILTMLGTARETLVGGAWAVLSSLYGRTERSTDTAAMRPDARGEYSK